MHIIENYKLSYSTQKHDKYEKITFQRQCFRKKLNYVDTVYPQMYNIHIILHSTTMKRNFRGTSAVRKYESN